MLPFSARRVPSLSTKVADALMGPYSGVRARFDSISRILLECVTAAFFFPPAELFLSRFSGMAGPPCTVSTPLSLGFDLPWDRRVQPTHPA